MPLGENEWVGTERVGKLILVLGGARSGKSAFAQRLARHLGGDDVLYVATAEAGDDEMRQRIAQHRRERPATWRTLEVAQRVGESIMAQDSERGVVLIDCLTLLVSNAMLASAGDDAASREVEGVLGACRRSAATFIVVSNEVGLGLVPDNRLGRRYRDALGRANQELAAVADNVYLMVAGLPLELRAFPFLPVAE